MRECSQLIKQCQFCNTVYNFQTEFKSLKVTKEKERKTLVLLTEFLLDFIGWRVLELTCPSEKVFVESTVSVKFAQNLSLIGLIVKEQKGVGEFFYFK